jgi:hypothetical protein
MNQQGRAFSTASIIFTAGVGSTLPLAHSGRRGPILMQRPNNLSWMSWQN